MTTAAERADQETGELVEWAPQDFLNVLRLLNFGDVATRLSTDYNALMREVKRLNRSGSISFKLTLKPVNKGGVIQMELYPQVSVSPPKEEMGADIMYIGDRGLQREHPRQKEIEGLRAVDQENRTGARVVDAEPRPIARTA